MATKFYVDAQQKGVVRGGWFDEMGGILVGMRAQEVCDALNASLSTDAINKEMIVEAYENADKKIRDRYSDPDDVRLGVQCLSCFITEFSKLAGPLPK